VPPQRSPGIIDKAFSFVSHGKQIQSPYNPEILAVHELRDQVEDYRFISFYGQSDEVSVAHQLKV
jgi:hypothetical protein